MGSATSTTSASGTVDFDAPQLENDYEETTQIPPAERKRKEKKRSQRRFKPRVAAGELLLFR